MSVWERITEYEFDRLSESEQMRYRYCPMCLMFFLMKGNKKCPCGGVKHV